MVDCEIENFLEKPITISLESKIHCENDDHVQMNIIRKLCYMGGNWPGLSHIWSKLTLELMQYFSLVFPWIQVLYQYKYQWVDFYLSKNTFNCTIWMKASLFLSHPLNIHQHNPQSIWPVPKYPPLSHVLPDDHQIYYICILWLETLNGPF